MLYFAYFLLSCLQVYQFFPLRYLIYVNFIQDIFFPRYFIFSLKKFHLIIITISLLTMFIFFFTFLNVNIIAVTEIPYDCIIVVKFFKIYKYIYIKNRTKSFSIFPCLYLLKSSFHAQRSV